MEEQEGEVVTMTADEMLREIADNHLRRDRRMEMVKIVASAMITKYGWTVQPTLLATETIRFADKLIEEFDAAEEVNRG